MSVPQHGKSGRLNLHAIELITQCVLFHHEFVTRPDFRLANKSDARHDSYCPCAVGSLHETRFADLSDERSLTRGRGNILSANAWDA